MQEGCYSRQGSEEGAMWLLWADLGEGEPFSTLPASVDIHTRLSFCPQGVYRL